MADEWENWNWEPPAPAPATGGPDPREQQAAAAPAAPGLKARTGMPSWFTDTMSKWWGGSEPGSGFNLMSDAFKNYFQGGPRYQGNIDKTTGQLGDVWGQYFGGGPRYQGDTDRFVGQLGNVWNQYQQLPGQIETKRQNLINQIYANAPKMQELYQPAMENMSRRGILNSSITGKALSDIQENVNRDIASQVAGANTWAADQGINYTTGMGSVLNNIINTALGASGAYSTQGTSALGGLGNVLGNQINASNLFSGFGKDVTSIGSNRQTLINDLIKLLQTQETWPG